MTNLYKQAKLTTLRKFLKEMIKLNNRFFFSVKTPKKPVPGQNQGFLDYFNLMTLKAFKNKKNLHKIIIFRLMNNFIFLYTNIFTVNKYNKHI